MPWLFPCGYLVMLIIVVHRKTIWVGLMTAFLLPWQIITFQYYESESSGRRLSGQFWLEPSKFCVWSIWHFFLSVEYFTCVLSEVGEKLTDAAQLKTGLLIHSVRELKKIMWTQIALNTLINSTLSPTKQWLRTTVHSGVWLLPWYLEDDWRLWPCLLQPSIMREHYLGKWSNFRIWILVSLNLYWFCKITINWNRWWHHPNLMSIL